MPVKTMSQIVGVALELIGERRPSWKITAASFVLALINAGEGFGQMTITSFDENGLLSWTNNTTNVAYQIEWRSNLATGWSDSYDSLKNISATGHTMSSEVPTSFRVRQILNVPGMNYIPPGRFLMGDSLNAGQADQRPVHSVFVSGFHMDTHEVSNGEMIQVMQWAFDNGKIVAVHSSSINVEGNQQELLDLDGDSPEISFANGVFSVDPGKSNFPCFEVSWYGAQAYCNYLSEMQGLEQCIDFSDWNCDFTKNGYRLPTEAEWEKAARGNLVGQHFPWHSNGADFNDDIYDSKANYQDSIHPFATTTPVGYYDGTQASPIGPDMANGYGLYDMAGNVSEWCWDWKSDGWYTNQAASANDTTGPANGEFRVLRGGTWRDDQRELHCANRRQLRPTGSERMWGFRAARCP